MSKIPKLKKVKITNRTITVEGSKRVMKLLFNTDKTTLRWSSDQICAVNNLIWSGVIDPSNVEISVSKDALMKIYNKCKRALGLDEAFQYGKVKIR